VSPATPPHSPSPGCVRPGRRRAVVCWPGSAQAWSQAPWAKPENPMIAWVAIVAVGVVSFVFRAVPMLVLGRRHRFERGGDRRHRGRRRDGRSRGVDGASRLGGLVYATIAVVGVMAW
jgi:hypothetical protein